MTVEAADPRAIPAHHQPVAVKFDFVNPEQAGRWPRSLRRQARFDEAEGTPHDHGRRIGNGRAVQPRRVVVVSRPRKNGNVRLVSASDRSDYLITRTTSR
jgi:hypothetical protein